MYLGAQRVRDDSGKQAVSLYCYKHGLHGVPEAKLRDVRWVSQFSVGQLVYQEPEGASGGRSVLSFLDISGPDNASLDEVKQVLSALRDHAERGDRTPLEVGAFGAEFYAGSSFPAAVVLGELDALAAELRLFVPKAFNATPPRRMFTVIARREADRTNLAWDEPSIQAIKLLRPDWLPAKVSVTDDVRGAFEEIHGSFYPQAVLLLSPLREEELRDSGGARVVDAVTKETLWFTADR